MPLAGLRVLDLSHVPAAPRAAYRLALPGADVVRIERPPVGDARHGDTARTRGPDRRLPWRECRAPLPVRGALKLGAESADMLSEAGFMGAAIVPLR